MRTNAASSVKDGRYYLQLAGAEARERLLLAAAQLWNVPVGELTAKDSVITHAASGRTTTYGRIADRAARTPHPHPEQIRIKSPDQWTLMGTEQKNLDVPLEGDRADGVRNRRAPAWNEVGGREDLSRLRRRRQELRLRGDPEAARCALGGEVPHSGSGSDAGPHLQRWRRGHCRFLVPGQDRDRRDADRVEHPEGERGVHHGEHECRARGGARSARHRARRRGRHRRGVRTRGEDCRGDVLDPVSAARADGTRQRHGARGRRSRGHLDWRSESAGDALQRREDYRNPRAERPSAPVPPGRRLRPERQRTTG